MTIVVRRDTGWFGALVRFRVRLDGVMVGRVGRGRALRLTGSGGPQRLSASIEWARSNELPVTDPGPDTDLEVLLTHYGATESGLRTFVAPNSVLVLVAAGEPLPAPPPLRLGRRRVAGLWLSATLTQVLPVTAVRARNGDVDLGDTAAHAGAAGLVVALLIGAVALFLRRRHR